MVIDRAHDTVTKLFVDQGFQGRAIDVYEFIESVDERIGGDRRGQRALVVIQSTTNNGQVVSPSCSISPWPVESSGAKVLGCKVQFPAGKVRTVPA